MTPPLVSIIIPSYNAAPWLPATLESALAQTHRPREIIVIDDGSTDESLALARTFTPRGVQVYSQPNRGAAVARNHGLAVARGDFVQYLDADDLLAPDKITRQLAHPNAADGSVLLSATWGRFQHKVTETTFSSEPLCADFLPVDFMITKFRTHGMMHPAAWLVSRNLIDKAGPWDERLSLDDDGEYFTRVVLAARSIRHCADSRSFYRSGLSGSLSRSRSARAWTSQFLSIENSVRHLLGAEDSPRTRAASADVLQRLIFESYPAAPALRRQAAEQVRHFGGSKVAFEAGPRFRVAAQLLGWRLAKRLRDRFSR